MLHYMQGWLRRRSLRRHAVHARELSTLCFQAAEILQTRCMLSTSVLSYHNDLASTGVNANETVLTPADVNVDSFRKRFATPVDGQVYAQPLYVPDFYVSGGSAPGVYNTVFVATQHGSVYAIDASSGSVLWQLSLTDSSNPLVNLLGASQITPMPSDGNISPEISITATPVIDAVNHVMYVEAKTVQIVGNLASAPHYVHSLFKIDLTSGTIAGSAIIADTIFDNGGYTFRTVDTGTGTDPYVLGTGDGSIQIVGEDRVYFNAVRQMDRPGLTLWNGHVIMAFASHGDTNPYHGWVLMYDADTLAIQGAFNTTPNGGLGGIWQSGGVVAIDAQGYMYVETGNGTFDSTHGIAETSDGFQGNGDYGDCFLKIALDSASTEGNQNGNLNGWGLKLVDYFSPHNNLLLENGDRDLGSGGPVLLPDSAGDSAHPHLMIGAGKEGTIYLLDRDNMGQFDSQVDHVVQEISGTINGSFGTPAFFNGRLYYISGKPGPAFSFALSDAAIGDYQLTPDLFGYPGGSPVVSANGTQNGIVWMIDYVSNTLRAYLADDLTIELWTSSEASADRDQLGSAVKFTVPTVADGLVFVGTGNQLVEFGPPLALSVPPAAPINLAATSPVFNRVNLNWTDKASNEDRFEIERSNDNVHWALIGTAVMDATSYSDTTAEPNSTYYYRVRAHNTYNGNSFSDYLTSGPVTTPQPPVPGTGDGLQAAYYYYVDQGGTHLQGDPVVTRVDSVVDSNVIWDTSGAPAAAVGNTNFSARWLGKFQPAFTETYTVHTITTGGVRLWINQQLVIDDWNAHSLTNDSASVALVAGDLYDVRMEYFQVTGGGVAQLKWTSASTQDQIVPQGQLFSGVAPAQPTNLKLALAGNTEIDLNWQDNAGNELAYTVERSTDGFHFSPITVALPANSTSYSDTTVSPGVHYWYRVRALNFGADSAYSTVANLATPLNFVEGISSGNVVLATFTYGNPFAAVSDFTLDITWGATLAGTPTGFIQPVSTSATGSTWQVVGSATYAEKGTPSVTVTVTSVDGKVLLSATTKVNVADAPLTDTTRVTTLNAVEANNTGTVVLATFTDANPFAPLSDFKAAVTWGSAGTLIGVPAVTIVAGANSTWQVQGSAVFAEAGTHNVSVKVTDIDGASFTTTKTTFNVADAALTDTTVPATLNSVAGSSTGTVTLATFTDADPVAPLSDFYNGTTHVPTVTWGPVGSLIGTPTVAVSLVSQTTTTSTWKVTGSAVYATPGLYTVAVRVNDVDGSTVLTGNTQIQVAPGSLTDTTVVKTLASVEGNSTGSQILATFSDSNPSAQASDFLTPVVSWGGTIIGTPAPTVQFVSKTATLSNWKVVASATYAEASPIINNVTVPYNVSVTVTQTAKAGGTAVMTNHTSFSVADAALTDTTPTTPISSTEGLANTGGPGNPGVVLMTFTDANPHAPASDFSVSSVIWGGALAAVPAPNLSIVSNPSFVGAGSGWKVVADSVTYAEKGTFTVTVKVADVDGKTLTSLRTKFSVVDAPLTDTTPLNNTFSAVEGNSTGSVVLAAFTDANPYAPLSDFKAVVTWGPAGTVTGVPAVAVVAGPNSTWQVKGSAVFAEKGTYNISVKVTDIDGASFTTTNTTFNVAEAALTDTTVGGTLNATNGTSTGNVLLASFLDANPNAGASDFNNIGVDWGTLNVAGTSFSLVRVSSSPAGSIWQVWGSAIYVADGTFTVTVSITDVDGLSLTTKKTLFQVTG
jgi:hypothetical protein